MLSKTQPYVSIKFPISHWTWWPQGWPEGFFNKKKIKRLEIKKINMEIWELLKSLFSEVNFLLKCLSCSRSSVQSHWWRQVQKGPLEPQWATLPQRFCKSSSAGRTDSQRSRSQNTGWGRVCHRVIVQKSHILGKCILFEQCAMLSKRLTNTVACCYETYRMRREGGGKFRALRIFVYCCDNSTNKHRGCKEVGRGSCSHVGVIHWECLYYWRNLPQLQTEVTLWSEEQGELKLLALCSTF